MIDPRIRLRHLRCFLETAKLGSLSAAANALNVSQPAASKTLRELENILGKRLFDRSHRRLILTAEGHVFQQHAGAGMIALTRAQDLVKGTPAAFTRLSVGVLPTAATSLMPRAALNFRMSFPTDTSRQIARTIVHPPETISFVSIELALANDCWLENQPNA